MIEHTPGAWEVGEDVGDGTAVVTFEARDICRVEMTFGDGEANARLIAAAPDMLRVLYMAALYLEHPEVQAIPFAVGAGNAARNVRDVIAKAEGKA